MFVPGFHMGPGRLGGRGVEDCVRGGLAAHGPISTELVLGHCPAAVSVSQSPALSPIELLRARRVPLTLLDTAWDRLP